MDSGIVAEAVKDALEEGRLVAEEESIQFDENEMAEIARRAAQEEVDLSHVLNLDKEDNHALPEERIKNVADSFEFMTYKLDITDVSELSLGTATFTRSGRPILPPIQLRTLGDISDAQYLEYSSIMVECVYMIMSAVGNIFSVSDKDMEEIAEKTMKAIKKSEDAKQAIDEMHLVWLPGSDSTASEKAKAIFSLIGAVWKARVFRKIIWALIKAASEKSNWIELIVKFVAYVAAAVATGGAALILLLAKAILQSTVTLLHFSDKFEKLKELEDKRKM